MINNTICVLLVIRHIIVNLWGLSFTEKYINLAGILISLSKGLHITKKTTNGAAVIVSKIQTIEEGRAAYKTALFAFEIFVKILVANITLICFFNEIIFYFFIA